MPNLTTANQVPLTRKRFPHNAPAATGPVDRPYPTMLKVRCERGHVTGKLSADAWRADRGCDTFHLDGFGRRVRCNAATVVVYRGTCPHHAWRYPNPFPLDGQLCDECGQRYVAHFNRTVLDDADTRAKHEAASVLIDESDGMYTPRETIDQLRFIFHRSGWTWLKRTPTLSNPSEVAA